MSKSPSSYIKEINKTINFETLGKPENNEAYRAFHLMTVPHGASDIMLSFKTGIQKADITINDKLKPHEQTFVSNDNEIKLVVKSIPEDSPDVVWMDRQSGLYHPAVLGIDKQVMEIPDDYSLTEDIFVQKELNKIQNSTDIELSIDGFQQFSKTLNENSRCKNEAFYFENWFNPETKITNKQNFTRINTQNARDRYITPYNTERQVKQSWIYIKDDPFSYVSLSGNKTYNRKTPFLEGGFDNRGNIVYNLPAGKEFFLLVYKGHASMGMEYTNYIDTIEYRKKDNRNYWVVDYSTDTRTFDEANFKNNSWESINTAVTIVHKQKMTKNDLLIQILENQIGGL